MARLLPRLLRVLRLVVLAYLLVAVWLWFAQSSMVYLPTRYFPAQAMLAERNVEKITSHTSQGAQTAYYLAASTSPPARLWVMFSGNASLALDWLSFVQSHRDPAAGYLFIDYPSYGDCEGTPNPATILENSEAAWRGLGERLHLSPAEMDRRMSIVGHSLGAATGLQFAAKHPVRQVILFSPFTSMLDMARRRVGWPLCYLSRHPFDNHARLAELAARPGSPRVTIFHGTADEIIPLAMSRKLRDRFAPMVTLHEIPDEDHDSIVPASDEALAALMRD